MKHSALIKPSIVAIGNLLKDTELKPSEVLTRTFIFHVPVSEYDLVEAHAMIPDGKNVRGLELEWHFDKDRGMVPTLFRMGADGRREAMKRDRNDGYEAGPGELQTAHAMSMISLW